MSDVTIDGLPSAAALGTNDLFAIDQFVTGNYVTKKLTGTQLGDFIRQQQYYRLIYNSSAAAMTQRSVLQFNAGFSLTDDAGDGITNVSLNTTYFNQNWVPLAGTIASYPLTSRIEFATGTTALWQNSATGSGYYIGFGNNADLSLATIFAYTKYSDAGFSGKQIIHGIKGTTTETYGYINEAGISLWSNTLAAPTVYNELDITSQNSALYYSNGSSFLADASKVNIGYKDVSGQTYLTIGASGETRFKSGNTAYPGVVYDSVSAGYVTTNQTQYSLLHRDAGDLRWSPIAGSASIVTVGTVTTGTWNATAIGAAYGGTGLASYTIGDLLYASGATTLSKLADVAAGSYLRSGGVGAAPLWSTLILPNAATANRIVYATSTNTWGDNANFTYNGTDFLIGGASADIWSLGASNAFFNFQAPAANNSSRTQIIANGTGAAGFQMGNTTIRRCGITGVDGSDMVFFTNTTNSGTALTERLRITAAGQFTFWDGGNFSIGTTTGTKIGTATTQKIAFWNKTPIVQPTTGITGAALVSNAGTAITSTDTFGGYTLQQLAAVIINTGLAA